MPKPFAQALRRMRLKAGLTLAEAGRLLGRHYNTIYRWESGDRVPEPLVQEAVLARLQELLARAPGRDQKP